EWRAHRARNRVRADARGQCREQRGDPARLGADLDLGAGSRPDDRHRHGGRSAPGVARDASQHCRRAGWTLRVAGMGRMRKWLGNLGIVLLLAAGLAAWVYLPWYAILGLAAA